MPKKKEMHQIVEDAIRAQSNTKPPKIIIEDFMRVAIAGGIADHLTAKGRLETALLENIRRAIIPEFQKIDNVPLSLGDFERLFDEIIAEILQSCDMNRANRVGSEGLEVTQKEVSTHHPDDDS